MATFIVTALATVMAGPDVVTWVARAFGLSTELSWLWGLVRWPLIVLLVVLGIDLVYHFAPNLKRDWAWLTPGSVLATALWIASSFAFKLYVANFADFNATHGAIGGVIVILLWFYVSSLAILVGAELNGVIEQSPRER
jgi:membrane protein